MSRYTVYVTPQALREVRELPGHIRQPVKRIIDGLADDPCPSNGKRLTMPESVESEVWRIRIDSVADSVCHH